YRTLLKTEGVDIEFTDDALDEIALLAAAVNEKTMDIGARRLHTMLEKLLEDEMFEAPDGGAKTVKVDRMTVQLRLADLVNDPDTAVSSSTTPSPVGTAYSGEMQPTAPKKGVNLFVKLFVLWHMFAMLSWSLPNPANAIANGSVPPTPENVSHYPVDFALLGN